MEKKLNLPGTIVKKDNELIRTKINIDTLEGARILANLIACINNDDTKFDYVYRVAVKDFITDSSGRGYTNIKNICRTLLNATAELEEVRGGKKYFRGRSFFTDIVYYDGIISAQFNPAMSVLLLDLRTCFTQYNLLDYLRLPSIYSQRIFEILKSWEKVEKGYVDIKLSELHRLLNSPNSQKKDFKEFRRYVLEKAHKDINGKTDLNFDWKAIKKGRAVEHIRFSFHGKKGFIAKESKEQQKVERQRKLESQRFIRAANCAKDKKGICENQDNVGIVCRMCLKYNFCDEMRKKYQL